MKLFFTDYPRFIAIQEYERAISRMAERLWGFPGIISVFRLGSISAPGISDIDMLAVFADGAVCREHPVSRLSKAERMMFVHGLYGAGRSGFRAAQKFTFFHNYQLLRGEKLEASVRELDAAAVSELKIQTALDYLIHWYISLSVELAYRIVRVRGLLLHAKAALYDLEFLNVREGGLFLAISKIASWRERWFDRVPERGEMQDEVMRLHGELRDFLEEATLKNPFCPALPGGSQISKNMRLEPSGEVSFVRRGLYLPGYLGWLGKKYFNLQHRFNRFTFTVPMTRGDQPAVCRQRNEYSLEAKRYNREHLPHFMAMASFF